MGVRLLYLLFVRRLRKIDIKTALLQSSKMHDKRYGHLLNGIPAYTELLDPSPPPLV